MLHIKIQYVFGQLGRHLLKFIHKSLILSEFLCLRFRRSARGALVIKNSEIGTYFPVHTNIFITARQTRERPMYLSQCCLLNLNLIMCGDVDTSSRLLLGLVLAIYEPETSN